MVNELKEFTQLGGTVVTIFAFLLYLRQKDEINKKTYDEFNKMIGNHLEHSTRVIEKNSEVITKFSVSLKELCMIIKNFNSRKKYRG